MDTIRAHKRINQYGAPPFLSKRLMVISGGAMMQVMIATAKAVQIIHGHCRKEKRKFDLLTAKHRRNHTRSELSTGPCRRASVSFRLWSVLENAKTYLRKPSLAGHRFFTNCTVYSTQKRNLHTPFVLSKAPYRKILQRRIKNGPRLGDGLGRGTVPRSARRPYHDGQPREKMSISMRFTTF